jgi:hypothetical protein
MSLALAMALNIVTREVLLSEGPKRFVVSSTAADLDVWYQSENDDDIALHDILLMLQCPLLK